MFAIILGGSVVVIYSVLGGMWSITLTDFVQFLVKTIGIFFILLPVALYKTGGISGLAEKLPADATSFTAIGGDTILTYFVIYTFGLLIGQDIWQRVFTARSPGVARWAGTAAGVYCLAVRGGRCGDRDGGQGAAARAGGTRRRVRGRSSRCSAADRWPGWCSPRRWPP